ncbi:MAG: fused MFS/spermidine synthase [Planctomycetes bacterium]|nr:fused MFS/spermidine synthase [Planctomycetota bacterium]MCW8134338.1 fused MFS/spermidine synthase [Planctomycetota bacterium]
MIAFAAAIFLSAFLLFLVQPLLGRFILPWYGGTPAAWSVALLFFQCALLAGYGYAHVLTRFAKPRAQAVIHAGVLLLAALTLPVIPPESLKPAAGDNPALSILWLLLATAGLPFVALSATGPLLQAWLARVRPGKQPWVMYALSNVGSLGALLAYPFVIEPWVGRNSQAWAWSAGFVTFALLAAACGFIAMRAPVAEQSGDAGPPPGPARRIVWVALSACGVWLLMAVTNRMSLDLAPVPFLWVLPLSLYLLSFIVTFAGERFYVRGLALFAVPLATAALAIAPDDDPIESTPMRIAVFGFGLFALCWTLHGELYRLRPHVSRLTGYYLSVSLGGALGGAFVGLAAPHLLPMYFEYEIGQALAILAVLAALCVDPSSPIARFKPRWAWLLLGIALLAWADATRGAMKEELDGTVAHTRSFFGVSRIYEYEGSRKLVHGTTTHGAQWTEAGWEMTPLTYYSDQSGAGLVLGDEGDARRVGVIGLGAGTLAAWGRKGDVMRFYEIDPEMEHVARTWFTYLAGCRAELSVVIGDGRLSLEREEPQDFDVLVLDAFSSDSIPVHLLTLESFDAYLRHLRDDGVLCVHVTNRYIDLQPVIAAAARELGLTWVLIEDDGRGDDINSSDWALLSRQASRLARFDSRLNPPTEDIPAWTDDHSNIFRLLK